MPLVSLTTSAAACAAARAASATAAVAAATAMACLLASKDSVKGAEEVEESKLLLLLSVVGNVLGLYLVLCLTKLHVFLSLLGLEASEEGGGLWCFLPPKSRRRKPMRENSIQGIGGERENRR